MRWFVLLLGLFAVTACHEDSDTLRIGGNRWLGYAPVYLADENAWLAPSGMQLIEYPNATGVLRGFRNGLLDAALLTLDETLALQASGQDLEIVLVTNLSAGADVLFAQPPIKELVDLRGQRIGVENTALGAFFLSRILDHAGLAASDVQIVSLPIHEHRQALADGRVDALVTFASEGPALMALGARRIFDSRALPGEIIDVLVVDRRRVSPEQRQRLRALWYEALTLWMDNRAVLDGMLRRRLDLSPEALEITLAGLTMGDRQLNGQLLKEGQLLASAERLAHYLHDRQLLGWPAEPRYLLPRCGDREC